MLLACLLLVILTACAPLEHLGDLVQSGLRTPSERYEREGDGLLEEERSAEALLAYRQAVQLNPKNVSAADKLASMYQQQGRQRLARLVLLAAGDSSLVWKARQLEPALKPENAAGLRLTWLIPGDGVVPVGLAAGADGLALALEDGRVSLSDPAAGALRWQVTLPTALTSAPVLGQQHLLLGGQDGRVYALNAADGKKVWTFQTGAPVYAAPLEAGGVVYVASNNGLLAALQAQSGTVIWSLTLPGTLRAAPALAGEVLYIGCGDGRLYALKARTGEFYWSQGIATQGAVESTPAVVDGRVFFGSSDGRVYALAAQSGGEYWRYSTPDGVYAAPLVVDGVVYAASSGGVLSALDAISAAELWKLRIANIIRETPLLAGGRVYYLTNADPHLYVVEAATGKPLGEVDTGDWLASPPLVVGGVLYLAGRDGALMAFAMP
jgi:outer membrane protein assembly factor BamB